MKLKRRLTRKEIKRKNKKIVLSIVIILLIITTGYSAFQTILDLNVTGKIKRTDYYVSSNGSDTEGDGTKNNPYLTIQKAYDTAGKKVEIFLMSDIEQISTLNLNKDKNITISSYNNEDINYSINRNINFLNNIIYHTNGILTLKKITIDGKNIESNGTIIRTNRKVIIEDKTILKNNIKNQSNPHGGAIYASGNNAEIIINGGEISNNTAKIGGAISTSKLTMNGGKISYNNSINEVGGGIYGHSNSNIIINKGEISNNTTTNTGGGIFMASSSTLEIVNCEIKNNTAQEAGGGIKGNINSVIIINGANISNNTAKQYGGAIHTEGNIIMNSGIIKNNSAEENNGGAIRLGVLGTMTMNGGIIQNNTAVFDGGISNNQNNAFTYNSGIICENTPSNDYETHTTCPN